MHGFILQIQLLLSALSAVLPLAPVNKRAQLAQILQTIASALALGEAAAETSKDLAVKFAALRAEIEHVAALSASARADELEAAFERVRAASAAFRAVTTNSVRP
jgi:hypothetical protein